MLAVGITGGIGSGKSTVAKIFEVLGIPVYYADDKAKWLMANDPMLRIGLIEAFGPGTFSPNEQLNRSFLAKLVFNDPEKLKTLNSMVHPAVARDSQAWHLAQKGVPYTLKEAALLYESGSFADLDHVIVVAAPESLRVQRVMDRDQVEAAAVKDRMKNQWPQSEKVEKANFVIHNDGVQPLIPQVLRIHEALTRKNSIP